MVIHVYDDNGETIKVSECKLTKIRFGTVRKLMKLVKMDSDAELIAAVSDAWDEVVKILDKCFPDMTEEDWDGVELPEIMTVIVSIVKYSMTGLNKIPVDSKN